MGEIFNALAREMRERSPEFLYPYREIKILGPRAAQQDYGSAKTYEKKGETFQVNIVADGHDEGGELYSEQAVRKIISLIGEMPDPVSEKDFEELFDAADKDVEQFIVPGGTTLSMVVLNKNKISGAYVGDSDVRLVSKDGMFSDLTIPDRLVNEEEKKRVKEAGGVVDEDEGRVYSKGKGINITRAIGDFKFRPALINKPHIFSESIHPADKYLLVASDGFWGVGDGFEDEYRDLGNLLASAKSLDSAESLVKSYLATRRQGDNITVQIIELNKKSE